MLTTLPLPAIVLMTPLKEEIVGMIFEQIERIPNLERKRAPSVSKMNPRRKAIRRLIEPAPIGVPQEFAESFAPTAKARTKPKMTARV